MTLGFVTISLERQCAVLDTIGLCEILIAAGNSADTALVPLVRTYLDYQAAVVRAMAVWALSQLMDRNAWTRLRHQYLPAETDDAVRKEWEDSQHF